MSAKSGPPDPVMVLGGICDPVTALTFVDLPGKPCALFSGHFNGEILQWCLRRQRTSHEWTGHDMSVLWIAATNSGNILFTQGREGQVKVWAREEDSGWQQIGTTQSAPKTFCNSTVCQLNSQVLLCVPSEHTGKVCVYSCDKEQLGSGKFSPQKCHDLQPECPRDYGMCMKLQAFLWKGQFRLAVGYESGRLALWDDSPSLLCGITLFTDPVMCMTVWPVGGGAETSADSLTGVAGSTTTKLITWKIDENGALQKHKERDVTNAGFSDIDIRGDGKILLTGGWDGAGRVFSVNKLKPLAVLTHHRRGVHGVAFSSDNALAMGGKNGYITVWHVYKT